MNRRFEQEEVGVWKSYIIVDHIAKERWGPHALHKGIEGEDWGELRDSYKEMNRTVGLRRKTRHRKQKPSGK